MKDRLLLFINKENLSAARFADILGVQRSSISHIISGRNKPGFDFIEKILLNYPSLNPEWLILGQGEMYKADNKPSQGITKPMEKQASLFDSPVTDKVDNKTPITVQKNKETIDGLGEVTYVNKSEIQRIVIFYNDKTFTEYLPQK